MYSSVITSVLHGINSILVQVEADISDGMPVFEMVGFLAAEVKEAKERVRTALKNLGYQLPVKRITINISPANIKKSGAGFDLPIAVAVLASMGIIPVANLQEILFIGEMNLNGNVQGVNGILPVVLKAKESGIKQCVIPWDNLKEAQMVPEIECIGVRDLEETIHFLNTGKCKYEEIETKVEKITEQEMDFSMIHGQKLLKRACEVAMAGMHNLLMIGPPGAGKTMVAKCIPSILPPMSTEEQMELSKIYSVCGLFKEREHLMNQRPFRAPHHTISVAGLTGGGAIPHPGEISLAHSGILFLDELPEFQKNTLEILRQPLEEKKILISRANGNYEFPADFVLISAMNPCRCGYYPDYSRCHCSQNSIQNYLNKISQPLLDRIDICVEAPQVTYEDLHSHIREESSKEIRKRVIDAQKIQRIRLKKCGIRFNSQMSVQMLEQFCLLSEKEERYVKEMYEKLQMTARTYHKMLRVARTIADLDKAQKISIKHLQEAVCYRGIDKKFWGE